MTANANVSTVNDGDTSEIASNNLSTAKHSGDSKKEKIYGAVFLSAVTGISAIIGFGTTLAATRKQDPKFFHEGIAGAKGTVESGASLALRALGWGTLYAVGGCGALFYGIWKLSGASNFHEFRQTMGFILPKIPKNNPPQSRTEFDGLTDLLTYVSEDWGKDKRKNNE